MPEIEKGEMTVKEAGRKGGMKTKQTHPKEFYHEIGRMGGKKRAQDIKENGISEETHEKLAIAGYKGGTVTKQRYGYEHYQEIGRKGGLTVAMNHNKKFLLERARKGAEAKKRNLKLKKKKEMEEIET